MLAFFHVCSWLTQYVAELLIPCQHLLSRYALISFSDARIGPWQCPHDALNSGHLVEELTNPPPLEVVIVLVDFSHAYSFIWSSNCHKVEPFSQLASLTIKYLVHLFFQLPIFLSSKMLAISLPNSTLIIGGFLFACTLSGLGL